MPFGIHILHHAIIRPFMRQIESATPWTSIGVLAGLVIEYLLIEINIYCVDGIIKCYQNNLGCERYIQTAYVLWNKFSIETFAYQQNV